jgi:hypothetical protein
MVTTILGPEKLVYRFEEGDASMRDLLVARAAGYAKWSG